VETSKSEQHNYSKSEDICILCENDLKLKYKLAKEIRELKMSNDEDTVLLLGLGLSLNQARVYLAILQLQKTTAG